MLNGIFFRIMKLNYIKAVISIALYIAGVTCLTGCINSQSGNERKNALFESIEPAVSGVSFTNRITTNDTFNLLTFEYIYIGGGVGIGDFNMDDLPDVFFVGNMVPSKLYLNKGGLKFEDITIPAGIKVTGFPFGVSVADVNADGLPDIYLSMGGAVHKGEYKNQLFINQGLDKNDIPQFKQQAKAYGLAEPGITIQSVFFDYDHDGDLDVYEATGGGYDRSPIVPYPIRKDGSAKNTDRLYRNDFDSVKRHPVFTNVSKQAGILEEGYGLGISVLDINEDGWPDIYVTNDYLSNDLLYINKKDGSFSEEASKYFNHTSHFAMGNDVGDINNDGLMDIVAVDMLPDKRKDRMQMLGVNNYDKFYFAQSQGYQNQYMRNTLQLNMGQGKFSEIGQMAGMYKTSWSWAPLFADFDNDGYQDLFITNGFGKNVTDLDFVKFRTDMSAYTNTNDKKVQADLQLSKALNDRPGIKSHPYLYRNNQDNTFNDMSKDWGFDESLYSNGAAYVDLDNDGDLDIVTNNIDAPSHIYKNTLNNKGMFSDHNFLRIQLQGSAKNRFATGSTIKIAYQGNNQSRFLSPVRGFESTVEQLVHFGLGHTAKVDTIEVVWPDGKRTIVANVKANMSLKINYDSCFFEAPSGGKSPGSQFFSTVSPALLGINHKDKHADFIDFNYERLIPRKYSENGQSLAVADVNGDGLEDFFVGGAFQQTGKIFTQQTLGKFMPENISKFSDGCVDSGAVFFDADDDGDEDLYVASGGNQFTAGNAKYQDRLYKNNGKGNFTIDTAALPVMIESSSCVVAADYDNDGDLDLFVGGGVRPGFYPQHAKSYLLRNDKGVFTDVTETVAPGLQNIGIVTSALWTDIDNDNKPDLLITGEWMPIVVYINKGNKLRNNTTEAGLGESNGLWQSLVAGDFDNDGDTDYIAGNWGLNSPYKCTKAQPMSICYPDFDKNEAIDPIISYYEDDVNYPVVSLDYITEQLPVLKKKFLHYSDYADAPTDEILKSFKTTALPTLYCNMLSSVFIENKGNGKLGINILPLTAQVAPLFGMMTMDINNDGNLDLVAVGNFYWTDVVIGKYDALKGLTMLGDGKGNFKAMSLSKSGFIVDHDARALVRVETKQHQSVFVVSQVLDSLGVFKQQSSTKQKTINPRKTEVYAMADMGGNRKRKIELGYGSGYHSQSSRSVVVDGPMKLIDFYDGNGIITRTVKF
jgi:enediyne biosynthesis protein E4